MNDAIKDATTKASIAAMRHALDDHTTDIEDHVSQHTLSAGPMFTGATAVVDFSGNSHNWRERALALAPDEDIGPLAMHLDLNYHATARVRYLDRETNRLEEWPLDPEQQEIADRYASRAIYRLTTIALAETPEQEAMEEQALAQTGGVRDQAEKLDELTARTIRMARAVAGEAALVVELTQRQDDREILQKMAQGIALLEEAQAIFKNIEWVPA